MTRSRKSRVAGSKEPIENNMVLFVCVENSFRSVLSEAIFNACAPVGWKAESAGVRPATSINPIVVDLLREIGIPISSKTPRGLTLELIRRSRRIITFGCLDRCPLAAQEKSEDWPTPTATGRTLHELRAIRDELRTDVVRFIRDLPGVF